jgi:hypothetical protein
VVPQHAGGDGTPRTPRTRDATDTVGARRCAQPFDFAHRGNEREIARRPDIGTAQRHKEIDVRGPCTDASELDERGARAVVIETSQGVRIELARDDRLRELSDIGALLTRKTRASQI